MDIPTSPSGHGFVSLNSCGFAFWWLIIFFFHLTTFAYNACFALCYWNVDDLYLMFALASHGIGMPPSDFRTISYVHMALAGVHGFYVVQMVLGSAKRCTLAFSLRPKKFLSDGKIPNESENPVSSIHDENNTSGENLWTRLKKVFGCITRKSDELSVNGKYFHGILICRELVESSLQTMQAIRMSRYLSHPYLNHYYVGLLEINCWSSVIIYSRWFWDDEAYRRFALVMCDCALDLMSTVGVAVLIVLSYIGQYDVRVNGFGVQILDDEWFAKMMNEAQVVLVTSWSDLVIRVIFSLGLLGATGKMKELLQVLPLVPGVATQPNSIGSLFTIQPSVIKFQNDRDEKNYNEVISPSFRIWNKSRRNRLLKMVHILIATWGMVVLALHIDASLRTH
ncbi:hypothetical protein GQ600_14486 [Phytophthora cactorum]|nr:hypothetical protein GQ600_14486 [Phytophthora cactorum]